MKFLLKLAVFTVLAGAAAYAWTRYANPNSKGVSHERMVERGAYLVKLGGCTDCHTPKIMTDQGPVDDPQRLFAGHPADLVLKPAKLTGGPWEAATSGMTAWAGPWGVSYASNLTPDPATGLWSEDSFIKAMRTGKKRGHGRQILPPMPWQPLSAATDQDLKAIYAYLSSLPPVFNSVPEPTPATSSAAQETVMSHTARTSD